MFKIVKHALAATFIAAVPLVSTGASDTQLWGSIAINGPVKDDSKLLLWFDGHARSRDNVSDLGVSIIRPALGWKVSNKLSLWAGYASVIARRENGPNLRENRIWQQATYPMGQVLGGGLSGRTRLEQRFADLGSDTGWRIRQLVRFARPFEDGKYSFIAWNELFVDLNDADWGPRAGYGQNRTFVGAGWQMAKNLRFEGGYLLNHINSAGPSNITNHVFSFGLFVAL